MRALFIFVLLLSGLPMFAEEQTGNQDYLPLYKVITDMPDTIWGGLKSSFGSTDALPGWGVMLGSTAVLYHYDQDILNDVQAKGQSWGLGNSVKYKSVVELGNLTLWSAPTDTAGWLYFMGDGTIPIVTAIGLVGTGAVEKYPRAYNTGIEMANGLLVAAIFDQAVKRMTGRESPSAASEPRGRFRPFPNMKTYSQNVSKYDAMPSGHIMSATVMFTVIEQEYPEYNYFMYPFEAVWLGVLGFGMVNVGVHWASDYPLGIAIGYVFGRSAVQIHHPERNKDKVSSWRFFPGVHPETGTPMATALYSF